MAGKKVNKQKALPTELRGVIDQIEGDFVVAQVVDRGCGMPGEILSRAELLECFTLERVGRSGSIFDPEKLRWVNAQLIHRASGAEILRHAGGFLPAAARALPREALERLLEAVRGNLATLADLPAELEPFLAARGY